jgi:hypothetical protein
VFRIGKCIVDEDAIGRRRIFQNFKTWIDRGLAGENGGHERDQCLQLLE